LRLAVDYSSRDSIVAPPRVSRETRAPRSESNRTAGARRIRPSSPAGPADVDLVRTGGERRLSDSPLGERLRRARVLEADVARVRRRDLRRAIDSFGAATAAGGVALATQDEDESLVPPFGL
jgi:hypothetical protein